MKRRTKGSRTEAPVWQSALLAGGCGVKTANEILPLKLKPLGERLVATPSVSGSMMPFDVPVTVGQAVTIEWDSVLSRYIVEALGKRRAA